MTNTYRQTALELDAFTSINPKTLQPIDLADLPPVSARPFIFRPFYQQQMERLWTSPPRSNAINASLMDEWLRIADIFDSAMNDRHQHVYSYNGQMGLGKSQAAQVACACLAGQYWRYDFTLKGKSWGAILVVELQSQADEAANTINCIYQEITRRSDYPAISKHSGNGVTFQDINDFPILVICHQAYSNSLQRLNDGEGTTIRSFSRWKGGERKLVIVDESISPISEYVLTAEDCQTVIGWLVSAGVDTQLRRRYPIEYDLIHKVSALLSDLTDGIQEEALETSNIFQDILRAAPKVNLQSLYTSLMADVHWDKAINRSHNARDRKDKGSMVKKFLRSIDRFLYEWSFFYRKGQRGTFNSASWLIPDTVGSIVILDGTADQDDIYKLFGETLKQHKANTNLRNYSNVNVHLRHETAGLGKSSLEARGVAEQRAVDLYQWLKANLTPDRKVLVCGHIKLENELIDVAKADPYFTAFHTSHWGRTTGLNDWRDCDVAVSASCNYRDPAWATSALMTSVGVAQGLQELSKRRTSCLVNQIINSKVAVDCLQMLFRTRIRKVTDAEGGCQSTDLYIMLPSENKGGDDIRNRILNEIPGASVKEWKFDGFSRKPGRGKGKATLSRETAIIRYLKELPSGLTPKSDMTQALGLTPDVWKKKVAPQLADPSSTLAQAMLELNIQLVSTGWGRSRKLSFEKATDLDL